MPVIHEITDLTAPELDIYARLTQAQLRNRLEPEKGIFIAESPKVIARALDAGYQPLSLLMERKQITGPAQEILTRCGDVPVYTADRELLAQLTGFALTRGVLCAFRRPAPRTVEQVCAHARRVAVLEGIVDSTNIGAIFRGAAALGMELPDKIASYIAENVTANVRQLEGTVNKILAYKDLLGSEADEATVTRAMQDILKKSNEYIPTPDNILDYISKYYGIEKEIICGQQRVKDAVAARQIAMYLIRGMTNLPVVEIGKVFDNRDHSTVLYSLKQVEKQMKKDPAFAETVKEIKTNINNRH